MKVLIMILLVASPLALATYLLPQNPVAHVLGLDAAPPPGRHAAPQDPPHPGARPPPVPIPVPGLPGLPADPNGPGTSVTPTFAQTRVDGFQSGEPGILVDSSSAPTRIFVVDPSVNTLVYTSTDDGVTFTKKANSRGGGSSGSGDSAVAVDADGITYVADLLGDTSTIDTRIPVSTSYDHGTTWDHMVQLAPTARGITWDRQWIAARGHGEVVVTARNGGTYAAWVSTDQARTFSGPNTITTDAFLAGPITVSPIDGSYWTSWDNGNQIQWGHSVNGITWSTGNVAAETHGSTSFPVIDVDDAGNLYQVWATSVGTGSDLLGLGPPLGTRVLFSSSTDGGATWLPKKTISDTSKVSLWPWITAGATGKVDVMMISATAQSPDVGGPTTNWDIEVAQSLNAATATPAFVRTTAVSAFHTGSICTGGLIQCPGPQQTGLGNVPTPFDRRMLDFFAIDSDPAGNAYISYAKDLSRSALGQPSNLIFSYVDIYVARQTGGDRIR